MEKIRFLTMLLMIVPLFAYTPQLAFANGVSFNNGDVMASTGISTVLHYDNTGVLLDTLTGGSGAMTGSTFDSSGNFYVTSFSTSNVFKYDTNGNLVGNPWATGVFGGHTESILIDNLNNVYIGHPDANADIWRLDLTGAFQQAYDVATDNRGSDWMDLAADQCTMFYTSEGRAIQRYDVCNDIQLPNFVTLPGSFVFGSGTHLFALRLLPGGGLLVADDSDIKQLDAAGAVINTYDISSQSGQWFALNLDPDGTTFWSATNGGQIRQFTIGVGGVDSDINGWDAGTSIFGLSVKGEITVSGEEIVGGEILPINTISLLLAGTTSSAMWLISLAIIGMGAFAVLRYQVLKQKK